MARPTHPLNITLDAENASRLARLAERMRVQDETLARWLLSEALEGADPEHETSPRCSMESQGPTSAHGSASITVLRARPSAWTSCSRRARWVAPHSASERSRTSTPDPRAVVGDVAPEVRLAEFRLLIPEDHSPQGVS